MLVFCLGLLVGLIVGFMLGVWSCSETLRGSIKAGCFQDRGKAYKITLIQEQIGTSFGHKLETLEARNMPVNKDNIGKVVQ